MQTVPAIHRHSVTRMQRTDDRGVLIEIFLFPAPSIKPGVVIPPPPKKNVCQITSKRFLAGMTYRCSRLSGGSRLIAANSGNIFSGGNKISFAAGGMVDEVVAKTEQADKSIPSLTAARMPRNQEGNMSNVHDATIARLSRRRSPWQRSRVRRRWRSWRSFATCMGRRSRHGRRNWSKGAGQPVRRRFVWQAVGAGGGPEDAACKDRGTDAGERFFIRCARQGRPSERKAMIDRGHKLSLARQASLLGLGRGSLYYRAACRPGRRPGDHAADRRAASGLSVRGQSDVT